MEVSMPRRSGALTTTERVLRRMALSRDPEGLIRRAGLGPTQKAVVRALLDGLSPREIAEVLGISASRVHEALQRALEHLERAAEEVRA